MLIAKECKTDKEDDSCKDDQTSADAQEAGKATGAMSYAFTSKSKIDQNDPFLTCMS